MVSWAIIHSQDGGNETVATGLFTSSSSFSSSLPSRHHLLSAVHLFDIIDLKLKCELCKGTSGVCSGACNEVGDGAVVVDGYLLLGGHWS